MNKKVREVIAKELLLVAKDLMGGCDKLPEGGMRDNCEKKKKENKDEKKASHRTVSAKTLQDPWKEKRIIASILNNLGDMTEDMGIYEQGWWDPSYRKEISIKLDVLSKYAKKAEKDINKMVKDIESTGWRST